MRACFLPCSGDPFIALLAIKFFKERWYDEVDRLYINYNNHAQIPPEVVSEFFAQIQDPKITLIYHPQGIEQGTALKEMTLMATEDEVMFLEEDAYIFTKGVVNKHFDMLKDYDIIGSPRGSCGQEILDASAIRYGLDYSGYGDRGPNWWPNFFFIKRNRLLMTDLYFGSRKFDKGYLPLLDYNFKEDNYGDTFVWASMQLRAQGLIDFAVPQHKASPTELEDKKEGLGNYHPNNQPFEWIHAGSLSSGWGGYFKDTPLPEMTDAQKADFETRCAFWFIAMNEVFGFDEFRKLYKKSWDDLIARADLDLGQITLKVLLYKELIGL